jgi:hypothetical protein
MLIKYDGKYQIYVGKTKVLTRWGRSHGHLAGVRCTLEKTKNTKVSVMEMALAYFGPENAIVFTIGGYKDEGKISSSFPMPDGEKILLKEHVLGLSPKRGDST